MGNRSGRRRRDPANDVMLVEGTDEFGMIKHVAIFVPIKDS